MSETTDATAVVSDESADVADPASQNQTVADEPTADDAAQADDAVKDNTDDDPVEDDEQPTSNAEAAKFRRRLRDTEQHRDQLAARVEALQRKHIETLLASTGVKPAAVFSVTDLDALVDADGTVNAEKVTAAVNTARDRFNIAPIGKGTYVPGLGNQPSIIPQADVFSDAFKPSRKRR